MKVIETHYNGYRFRSRLEARWAVFFDALGIEYEYEKEGYDLGEAGLYLPDFWLPKQDCWIEIKGAEPTEEEGEKCRQLAIQTGKSVYVFFGQIPSKELLNDWSDSAHCWFPEDGWDNAHWWCECPDCGLLGIQFNGRSARLSCSCPTSRKDHCDKGYNYLSPRLLNAYQAARSARFEHGEKPSFLRGGVR